MIKPTGLLLPLLIAVAMSQVACKHRADALSEYTSGPDTPPRAVIKDGVAITLRDQKLTVIRNGKKVKDYDISTSKFGIGATRGSWRTPTGVHAVSQKVGDGQPKGMVFKGCRPTGEVVGVDAPGRDPIVTRVIQLTGLEQSNRNSHSRRIYIHGTPEERTIGSPASYGCIRMRSNDVLDLYPRVHRGMPVVIERCSQDMYLRSESNHAFPRFRINADAPVETVGEPAPALAAAETHTPATAEPPATEETPVAEADNTKKIAATTVKASPRKKSYNRKASLRTSRRAIARSSKSKIVKKKLRYTAKHKKYALRAIRKKRRS